MNEYKNLLQLYKHPFTLIRLGCNRDGGYVIPKELINSNLLSCGISNEISFEEDYIKHLKICNVHCFDGTINNFPSKNITFNWHKINIGSTDSDFEVSLNTIFEKCFNNNEIFMKMDIEGSEYPAFDTIFNDNLKKINCLVIEVHWIDRDYEKFKKLMNKIKTEMVLIHKHDNNNGNYFQTLDSSRLCNVYAIVQSVNVFTKKQKRRSINR